MSINNLKITTLMIKTEIEIVSKNLIPEKHIPHNYPMKKIENFSCFHYKIILQVLKFSILNYAQLSIGNVFVKKELQNIN